MLAETSHPRLSQLHPRRMCECCQGNGEIVTDWDRYNFPDPEDMGMTEDYGVEECPECDGVGWLEADAPQAKAGGCIHLTRVA
jgi:hypothetical protein